FAAKRTVVDAHQISRMLGASSIGPEHLLLALAASPESAAGRRLAAAGVTPEGLKAAVAGEQARPGQSALPRRAADSPGAGTGADAGRTPTPTAPAPTPALDELGRDLTVLARDGQIDPVIGRDDEIAQTVEVLSRRGKN